MYGNKVLLSLTDQDALWEGVSVPNSFIMSPHYMAVRDGNESTIPKESVKESMKESVKENVRMK